MAAYHCINCANGLSSDVVSDFCADQCEDDYRA
jgi:hypothetical protein